jgi:hypothetical protein
VRKVTAGLFVSLDGVVESPERWQLPYFNDEMGKVVGAAMAAMDAMILGRVTYQEFASYWPAVSAQDQPFAGHMNSTPKYIVYDGSNEVLKSNEWDRSGWPIPGSPSCPLRRITISSPCAGVDRKPFLTTSTPKAGRITMSRGT